jgi:large subunit ribosomal protein L24
MKKHVKGNRQLNTQSEIKEMEAWVQISNVALIDPESGKPTRVRYQTKDDGTKVRVAVGSGKEI